MGQMGKEKVQNTDYDALFKASPEDRVLWWMQLTKNEQGHYLMGVCIHPPQLVFAFRSPLTQHTPGWRPRRY